MCIKVCPTGIDIRNGLQLECVHCTQCIDACDSVMEKLSRPLGLIKYNTESALEGNKKKIIRPRLFIYLAACLTFAALMLNGTLHRKDFVIVTHRESGGQMYSVDDDGLIVNLLRVQLSNYLSEPLTLSFTGTHPENMIIISPEGQIVLQPEEKRTSHLLLKIPASTMREHAGVLDIDFVASDQRNFKQPISIRILGPAK